MSAAPSLDPKTILQEAHWMAQEVEKSLPMVLTVNEAAALARVARSTIYELSHAQGFPVVRFGRAIRIPRDPFIAWLERQVG